MKKKLKCFVCHKEINEEEDYVFKGQTVHKGVCLKSMIDEYNTIRNLQIRNKRLCSEIDRLNKEYERIYNENCKLRENHNINDITLLDENERLNNIINYIWQVFENGSFEDGCDCIKIYDYLKALKEG